MLRASAEAEKAGIPTVNIIGSAFMKQAAFVSKAIGIPFALAEYPGAPMVDSEDDIREKVDKQLMPAILEGLTRPRTARSIEERAEPQPGSVVFTGTLDEVEEHFVKRLWTDGLPIIPPTAARVAAFLRFTDRAPDEIVGVLPLEGREATIHSIAVNGVMAGCRPEYMPVLIAIVQAIAKPGFRLEDAGSTPSWEPLVILSGPIIKDLDFNHGAGLMKVGRQANTSVGRFLRLFLRNVCGYRTAPGDGDKGSIGYTFNVALAEDEEWAREIGWPSFGEEMGHPPGENAVTVQSVVCISPPTYSSGAEARGHVQQFVDVMGRTFSYWAYSGLKRGYWHSIVVIGPGIAKVIAKTMSKDDVRRYLWEHATIPASLMQNFARQTGGLELDFAKLVEEGYISRDYVASIEPDRPVRIFVNPKDIGIVVAGDPGRNQSRGYMANHEQGARTTQRIELPKDWKALLADVRRSA
ncbi:MAG: hypothetical protein ACM3SS_19300 [Rhodospirillaceae bacterium]